MDPGAFQTSLDVAQNNIKVFNEMVQGQETLLIINISSYLMIQVGVHPLKIEKRPKSFPEWQNILNILVMLQLL